MYQLFCPMSSFFFVALSRYRTVCFVLEARCSSIANPNWIVKHFFALDLIGPIQLFLSDWPGQGSRRSVEQRDESIANEYARVKLCVIFFNPEGVPV